MAICRLAWNAEGITQGLIWLRYACKYVGRWRGHDRRRSEMVPPARSQRSRAVDRAAQVFSCSMMARRRRLLVLGLLFR